MRDRSTYLTDAQFRYVDFMMDVLVYTVVLNLFVYFFDSIVIDSFPVSLLTAIVLKLMIDVIQYAIRRVVDYFSEKDGPGSRVALVVVAEGISLGSKIVILEVIDFIFEEDVDLGGFFSVLVLVVTMMLARRASTAVFRFLGRSKAEEGEDGPR